MRLGSVGMLKYTATFCTGPYFLSALCSTLTVLLIKDIIEFLNNHLQNSALPIHSMRVPL